MDHIEFFPYHNRHIKFKYKPPKKDVENLDGVLLNIIPPKKMKHPTDYIFIPTENLKTWEEAHKENKKLKQKQLQRIINIEYIISAKYFKKNKKK